MTFQVALTSPQLTKLRSGSYSADYLLKLCTNSVVLAGQLNGAIGTDWAQFTYDNVSAGAYTAVKVGQALLISATNDIQTARYRGRVRLAPTSSIVYTNESSAEFADNSYFWIINTFDAQYKLSRPDANGTELIDYDEAYHGLRPSVTGLQTAYFNYDPAGGAYRIAFSVSAIAKQSGNTISSYQFTFAAGTYTVISGSLSSATVTVDFNPGEQWGQLVVTDSGGITATRNFLIEACDDSVNPPDFGFNAPPISCDLSRGWSLSLDAFAGIDSMLNNTFVVIGKYNEQYGGTAGGLFTDNIAFCGWFQRETDPASSDMQYGVIETATLDFNGIGAALARLNSQLVPFFISASPTQSEQVKQLTPWRAVGKFLDDYTTIGTLCDIAFDDTSDTFLFPTLTTQGGNALSVIQGIAQMVASVIEFAPDGRIQMVKDVTYQSSTERSADVTVANWQAQDFVSLSRAQEENPNYGLTDTDGAYYNLTNGRVVGFTARAPGIARGEAEGNDNLPSQVLAASSDDATALAELIQRATNRFNFINNNEYLDAEFPDGYNFLIPSRQQLYTVTASALTLNGVNRISYDTSTQWLLESCSITRNDNGATVVRGRLHRLQAIGTGGINTTLVPPGDVDFGVPDLGLSSFTFQLPEINIPDSGGDVPAPIPPNPTIADATGQTVIAKNSTNAWLLRNFINLTVPQATMVTPSDLGSYTIKQVLFDPFSTNNSVGAYILASDGTNSAVWYSSNVAASPPIWTKGADVSGVYTIIRALNSAGFIEIYSPNDTSSGWTETLDFTLSEEGFGLRVSCATPEGAWTLGSGWQALPDLPIEPSCDGYATRDVVQRTFASTTLTSILLTYNYTLGSAYTEDDRQVLIRAGADLSSLSTLASDGSPPVHSGTDLTLGWTGSAAYAAIELNIWASGKKMSTGTDGSSSFKKLTITGTGTNPFGGGTGGAASRVSGTNGAAWSTSLTIGTTPGSVGGFDVQRVGANSFAASSGKVRRASTIAGAWGDYYAPTGGVEAACIIIPYFNWAGTKQTDAAHPDIIVGLTGADGSSRTLLWIEGGATPGTVHDLTPVANYVFDNPNAVTVAYQHHIACMGKISSTYTLRTTNDQGATWINRGTLTSPMFIRTRRNDSRASVSGTNKGQLYVAQNNVIEYSSTWGSAGVNYPRTMPATGINGFDILG